MTEPIQFSFVGNVPVFPLPGMVFFPRTVLPLHIFEARYREMIRDVMKGERLIAVSLLRPGWEDDYEGNPPYHDIGTLGRIEDLEPLSDGRYNLRLVGLQRVRFGELIKEKPYRLAHITPLAETPTNEDDPRVMSRKLDVLASHSCLLRELTSSDGSDVVLDERIPFETAVNGACANLPVEPSIRQSLLEEDDLFERQNRALDLMEQVLQTVLRLKVRQSRSEGEGEGEGEGEPYLN